MGITVSTGVRARPREKLLTLASNLPAEEDKRRVAKVLP